MSDIKFRMVAWTDAAGKYDPNAPLNGNEDNYYADDDLSDESPSHIVMNQDLILSDCGMIMAVADGMGGMNAGEVASQIAHDTVAEYFSPRNITPQLAKTHESRSSYMEKLIREADSRIKSDASHNSEHKGMGSTLILAWLVGNELSVTWIGDSRAYRYNPRTGIEPLSKDHSYVQELVDKGIITYEQTFEHPQGNIITRSLGDESQKPRPESKLYRVHDGDIILLCSDGLSGVLRDCKTYDSDGVPYPGENIEDIIREHSSSLKECREALWAAAERADWYDNVTAILCEIRSGAGEYMPIEGNKSPDDISRVKKSDLSRTFDGVIIKISRSRIIAVSVLLVAIIGLALGYIWYDKHIGNSQEKKGGSDSLIVAQPDEIEKPLDKSEQSDNKDTNDSIKKDLKKQPSKNKKDLPVSTSTKPSVKELPVDALIKSSKTKKSDSLTRIDSSSDKLTPVKSN